MAPTQWILLAYRLPREPSTPRIALWRALRRLGAARLSDGLVALPADARTKKQLQWLADSVLEAGGQATIWVATADSRAQERDLVTGMRSAAGDEYRALAEQADGANKDAPGSRRRTLGRLRRELCKVRRRDYFRAPEGEAAAAAIERLAASVEEVAA